MAASSSLSTIGGISPVYELPKDVLINTISYLDIPTIHSVLGVTKAWREASIQSIEILVEYRKQLETIISLLTHGDHEEEAIALELFKKHVISSQDDTNGRRTAILP